MSSRKSALPSDNDKQQQPRFLMGSGRGGSGKSLCLSYMIERCLQHSRRPLIADLDRTNRTLSQLYPEAFTCEEASDSAVMHSCIQFLDAMIASQTSAIMDIGGGDFIGLKILTELSIVDLLQANNFKVTFLFPVGSDPDYLAPVARLLEMNLLEGADIIMALNGALADESSTGMAGFKSLADAPEIKAIREMGGQLVFMPKLPGARVLAEHRLTLSQAAADHPAEDGFRLGVTRSFQVRRWLAEMDQSFDRITGILP